MVLLDDGGLFIINNGKAYDFFCLLQQTIAERVKNLVPARICEMLPSLVESRVNPMLARIPLYIPFSEITSSLNNILSPNIPPHVCHFFLSKSFHHFISNLFNMT